MKQRVKLGATVSDRITGFKGLCTARSEYLTGCDHIAIQSEKLDKDGVPMKFQWFDEPMVKVIKEPATDLLGVVEASPKPGGPQQHPC